MSVYMYVWVYLWVPSTTSLSAQVVHNIETTYELTYVVVS